MSPASPPNTDHVEQTLGMVMRPHEAGQWQSEMWGPSGASPPGEMSPRRDAEMPQSSISQLYPGPDLWWDLREDPGWWSRAWVSVGLTFVLLFIRTERIIRRGCDKLATHNSSRRLALSARKWRRKYLRAGRISEEDKIMRELSHGDTEQPSRSQVFQSVRIKVFVTSRARPMRGWAGDIWPIRGLYSHVPVWIVQWIRRIMRHKLQNARR